MSYKCGSVAVLLGFIVNAVVYGEKRADFSRFVVTGDSLGAGYQNSQLIESGQVHGYANVIATQAGVSLNLPLLPPPGYPQISIVQNFAVVTGLTPVARLNTVQTLDVAVPGFSVAALVGFQPSCTPNFANSIEVMAAEILNPNCSTNPGPTELAEAAALKPTTAILWIGSTDVLFTLLFGTDPTDVPTFSALYHVAATTMAHASEHLVIANVPDVTLTAYLTSVPKMAAILKLPVPVVEAVFGLQGLDMVTPYAFPAIQAMGSAPTALPDSGPQGPIVIRAARLSQIRAAVLAYNAVIAKEAADNGATLVDIHSLVNDLAAHGAEVDGRKLTTSFMGGLFSLDGVHPTNTGNAIIANEFIKTMNRSLGTDIPPVSVEEVSKTDPLIFRQGDQEGDVEKETGHVSVGMAEGLRALGRR
ncbi:MAG TPA: SGNH/GDSL hydrolase family protein [Candidatus Acidoferrales bacterium]|nr:SGNH/GDSL hydrolase family protein [Candidatus Acidoferrales bacterium]